MEKSNGNLSHGFWFAAWRRFTHHKIGVISLFIVGIFCLIAIYAPLLASSKPIVVKYDGNWYFPLFNYLFYREFFTKRLDIFFNLLMFTFPLFLIAIFGIRKRPKVRNFTLAVISLIQILLFLYFAFTKPKDPAVDISLNRARQEEIQKEISKNKNFVSSWNFDLKYMDPYAQLNLILRYQQRKLQDQRLKNYAQGYVHDAKERWLENALRIERNQHLKKGISLKKIPSDEMLKEKILSKISPDLLAKETSLPTLWKFDREHDENEIARQLKKIEQLKKDPVKSKAALLEAEERIAYIQDKQAWLEQESHNLQFKVMPLFRPFHWEDDAGGEQSLNRFIPWWELTRVNHKDLTAGLIFGTRISLVVGFIAVAIALMIGIPVGALAGYYGGKTDIIFYRLIEIWESMPVFFMLLMVVAVLQSKSIFLVIAVIGIFSWTGFSRYIRGEFFKQRNLPYVESCKALGYRDPYIIFSQILPNAIPPLLTLLPFAVMGAITSEAGLSFLGLGEEGSTSWGVLMDEGRNAFPGESYLLWPPAIMLTILLVAIALVGDSLRDAIDPKTKT